MKRVKTLLVLAVLILMTILTGCQQNDDARYKDAQSLMSKGEYLKAAEKFTELGSYEDSTKYAMYCKAINAAESGQYEAAFTTFEKLGDFKDCELLIQYYSGRNTEAEASEDKWRNWVSAANSYQSLGLFLDASERRESCLIKAYAYASQLIEKGKVVDAYSIFMAIQDYKDSYERAVNSMYALGTENKENGNWDDAVTVFEMLGNYLDSATQIKMTRYAEGTAKREKQDWDGARHAFAQAGTYEDSEIQIKETWYQEGIANREIGKWEASINAFDAILNYKDSAEQKKITYYTQGVALREAMEWETAVASFKSAGDYCDAEEQVLATYYFEGLDLQANRDWDGASNAFINAQHYQDADQKYQEVQYQKATQLENEGNQAQAYSIFMSIREYKDAYERACKPYYDIGIEKQKAGEWEEAIDAFEKVLEYSDSAQQILATYYEKGCSYFRARHYKASIEAFLAADEYKDSKTKILEASYALGEELSSEKKYREAITAYMAAGDYLDAVSKVQEISYQYASELYENGSYSEAIEMYKTISDYKDVKEILAKDAEESKVVLSSIEKQESADLVSCVIYSGADKLKNYIRPESERIQMPAGDNYTTQKIGVMTFRGTAFRQNAAVGEVTNPTVLEQLWQVEAGSAKGAGVTYYGYEWTGQPAIVKWSTQVREGANIDEEKRVKSALREVIIAGVDGVIRFLDLEDGVVTRSAINLGYPMKGTPSVHPAGYPYMNVGQYTRKMKSKTGSIGLRQYNLYTQKEQKLIDGLDGKLHRGINRIGSFETSSLIDRTSDTVITLGSNGLLYLTKLNAEFDYQNGIISFSPQSMVMSSRAKGEKKDELVAVESSHAMYGQYVFYADMGGVLRCVDTDTLTPVWAAETGDSVMAAVALDKRHRDELDLYTGNMLSIRKSGNAQIRRYNALNGKELWTAEFGVDKDTKTKEDVGVKASPVIGQNALNELVYFTVTGLSNDGCSTLKITEGTKAALIALEKESGKVRWAIPLSSRSESSPVAVYDIDGNGWIIQCAEDGMILLLDGLTGLIVNSLKVNGNIKASPAVYNDIMVIGTTGKGAEFVYGIRIK